MAKGFFSRGFLGRRREVAEAGRLPPGQYLTSDFPVLSAGPTPYTPKDKWDFRVMGAVETPQRWSWDEFQKLPRETVTVDIHCVTKWSKFDTRWSGFSLDMILGFAKPQAQYLLAFCDGGYITNLPLADVTNHKAWIVDSYDGLPLPPEHGGPVRLLVPHLYFWKSAKWIRGLRIVEEDQPGFWESLGYHNYGDPWKEQRYQGD
jgi:DMSO/TMAO reductase YedYZ molybdopterin-dependent catalytic subunit